jgi:hypothetical protein
MTNSQQAVSDHDTLMAEASDFLDSVEKQLDAIEGTSKVGVKDAPKLNIRSLHRMVTNATRAGQGGKTSKGFFGLGINSLVKLKNLFGGDTADANGERVCFQSDDGYEICLTATRNTNHHPRLDMLYRSAKRRGEQSLFVRAMKDFVAEKTSE